jgi:membrane protease YdiL (CAAX protease family)
MRIADRRLTWLGPLLLVTGRTVLILLAQGLVAILFLLRGRAHPWLAAAPWWTVYGTLVDIGCLTLMWKFTHKEGIRLRDLIGPVRLRYGRDFFLALGILVVMFPLFVLGAAISTRLIGAYQPFPGLTDGRVLPLLATIYSFSVWWMIWSPTEELTYAGYALPRLQALGGTWFTVGVVGFWWTIQHPFLPFLLDWHNFLWRFVSFLPAVVALTLIYLRLRRLGPLIMAHWAMDIVAVFMTLHR